jgi:multicomponent Na+:H+ antiporter subunit E
MRATPPLRLNASARVQSLTLTDRQALIPAHAAQPVSSTHRPARPERRQVLRRCLLSILVLSVMWGGLTGWRVDALIFGLPAILLGAMVPLLLPPTSGFRLSSRGAVAFALWFALQSIKGAVDVAFRALSPNMGLRPCFRTYPLNLPQGAPRITFINIITLLPGTLSAEINDDMVTVHMLDARIELEPELAELESRIRALFALPQPPEHSS